MLTGYEHERWSLGDIVTVDDRDLNLTIKTGLFADNTIFRSHGKLYRIIIKTVSRDTSSSILADQLVPQTTSLGRKLKIWCRLTICVIVEQTMALLIGRIQV